MTDANAFAEAQMGSALVSTERAIRPLLPDCVTFRCGTFSYGVPKVWVQQQDHPRVLEFGEFCSIGPEVQIFVGRHGRHETHSLSTFPLGMLAPPEWRPKLHQPGESAGNLDVRIGSDVWIGSRVTIMAGVTIGHGAVIGAGSIVTRDVEPYSVVAGAPARLLRHRFEDADVRSALLASRWWLLKPAELWPIYPTSGTDAALIEFATRASDLVPPSEAAASEVFSRQSPAGPSTAGAKTLRDFADLVLRGDLESPRLPPEDIQRQYTGAVGEQLMERSVHFVSYLAEQLPVLSQHSWRGLDFGVGWGRLAMLMRHFGPAEALDVADAWPASLALLDVTGLENSRILVPEVIGPGNSPLKSGNYDFVYAFSLFTHLARTAYVNTLDALLDALAPGGTAVITVRPDTFVEYYAAGKPDLDVPSWNGEEWFVPTYSSTYGESVMSFDVLREAIAGRGQVVDVTQPGLDPFQTYVAIRKST